MSNDSSSYVVPLLINGKEVTTNTIFPVISPSSHKQIWSGSSASVDDANAAADAAQAAFKSWSKTKPAFRRDILLKASEIFAARGEECGSYMMQETGAEQAFSGGFNVPLTAEMFKDVAGRISSIAGVLPTCSQEGTSALVIKEPWGVILGIAPW
jgi:acyl-CoA reductase-like NAD-dependent aldehyde dehydrogenase